MPRRICLFEPYMKIIYFFIDTQALYVLCGCTDEARKIAEEWLTDEDVIQFVDDIIHSKRDKY